MSWRKGLLLAVILGASTLAALSRLGYCLVETHSVPAGIWQKTQGPLVRGQIVNFCPPDTAFFQLYKKRGYPSGDACPGHYPKFIKPVAALAGDLVEVSASGIRVNGQRIPNSRPLKQDPSGRPLVAYPLGTYRVAPKTVWFVSHYDASSLDSRYFGPLSTKVIDSPMKPVWVERPL